MAVPAPSDKRFRRAHVPPTRRRGWLAAPRAAVIRAAVVTAVVLYGGYWVADRALSAEALTITRISVEGNTRMSRGEVVALLDGLTGSNMITVDLEDWRQKLLSSPWVADAAMRRVLPGTVAVAIAERQPVAVARVGSDLYLLDQHAVVVDEYGPNYAEFDLPIIDGMAAIRDSKLIVDPARAALTMHLLAALQTRSDLMKRISQIDVGDAHDAAVILKEDPTLIRLGEDEFVERLQSYVDLAPALRERVAAIDSVDLRFGERVYVKPQPGSTPPAGAKR
jgi:cell division septal protein FtsQ